MANTSGRKPRIRDDYTSDAQGLLHLSRAVMADSGRDIVWRNTMAARLRDVATDLLQAPAKV